MLAGNAHSNEAELADLHAVGAKGSRRILKYILPLRLECGSSAFQKSDLILFDSNVFNLTKI